MAKTMQESYDETLDKLTPLMPPKGASPEELAGCIQAMLTCAVNIGMCCYRVPESDGRRIVQQAWTFVGERLQEASRIANN